MYEKYLDMYYDEIYEEYCKRHPEEITSDFMLEDGNEDYIEEIIKDLFLKIQSTIDYNDLMTIQLIDSIYEKM